MKKECRHCGVTESDYCETCYQELIAENTRLQTIIHKQKNRRKFDQKNRILIPIDIFNKLNIKKDEEVIVDFQDGKITIEKDM